MNKQYMGDGVYAEKDENANQLILTTENGLEITNTIILGPEEFFMIYRYVKMNLENFIGKN